MVDRKINIMDFFGQRTLLLQIGEPSMKLGHSVLFLACFSQRFVESLRDQICLKNCLIFHIEIAFLSDVILVSSSVFHTSCVHLNNVKRS